MRSSNAGLGLKAWSCTEALITVMMHEVRQSSCSPCTVPAAWGEMAVKKNHLFNCATGAFTVEISEPGKKAEYSVQFVSVYFQSQPHEKFI